MKERISSFIIACALVFSCVAIPFLTRPVPAQATGVEGMLSWEYMMHLWALEGLFTHDSANYYGGFQGYTDEQKSNAMSGLKDFYDGQTRDLKNWLVVGKGIAEAKVNDWWDKLKSGTLDLVGDVGSAVYDWLNSKSGEVANQWASGKPANIKYNSDGNISGAALQSYLFSLSPLKPMWQYQSYPMECCGISYLGCSSLGFPRVLVYEKRVWSDGDISYKVYQYASYPYNKDTIEWSGPDIKTYDWQSLSTIQSYIIDNPSSFWTDIVKDGEKVDIKPLPTYEDLENQKQLPTVIDTYGGNLPQPYKKPENNDKHKPVPFVPTPVPVDWTRIHGDADGSGGVKIIIKDTDINTTKQFNYNEYKKLQVQIKKLSQTLNKILNLKQYNIQNNTEIDGDGKTLPIIRPDFHQAIDLKKKFPFSLPWDVLYIFKLFNSTPEAPAVTIDYPVISKGSGWGGYTVTTKPIVVDFNTDTWNKVAKVCRVMLFLLFAVGVCWAFFVK